MNPPDLSLFAAPRPALLASKKHTLIFLGLLALITSVGAYQNSRTGSGTAVASRLPLYLSIVVLQLLWLRYTQTGLKAHGHSIVEFLKPRNPGELGRDLLLAVAILASTQAFVFTLRHFLGGVHANTASLLPRSLTESVVWVLVSIVAGVSEEVAFRGYLQSQFVALTGHAIPAVLLQAAIFGVSHGYQGGRAILVASGYGLIFGFFAWQLKTIRPGIIAHAVTDLLGGLRVL